MRGTILAPASASSGRDPSGPHPVKLVFRFGIGMVELAGGTLVSALRVLEEIRAAPAPAGMPAAAASPANDVPAAARHVVLGAIVTTPRALAGALARAGRVAGPARQIAGRAGRLLGRAPGVGLARRRWEALRARAGTELAAWAAVGQQEEAAGRSLARAAVAGFFELAIARVAESPDLKRVIEEQSQGVTVAAVTELRERSRQADSVVEAFARRFTRFRASGSK